VSSMLLAFGTCSCLASEEEGGGTNGCWFSQVLCPAGGWGWECWPCVYSIWKSGLAIYSPSWPGTHNPPTSASQVLGLQKCATMPSLKHHNLGKFMLGRFERETERRREGGRNRA
jgi:hypothetical protein